MRYESKTNNDCDLGMGVFATNRYRCPHNHTTAVVPCAEEPSSLTQHDNTTQHDNKVHPSSTVEVEAASADVEVEAEAVRSTSRVVEAAAAAR